MHAVGIFDLAERLENRFGVTNPRRLNDYYIERVTSRAEDSSQLLCEVAIDFTADATIPWPDFPTSSKEDVVSVPRSSPPSPPSFIAPP